MLIKINFLLKYCRVLYGGVCDLNTISHMKIFLINILNSFINQDKHFELRHIFFRKIFDGNLKISNWTKGI